MSFPKEVLLGTLHSPLYRVISPIPVTLEKKSLIVVATWEKAGEFGFGATMSEALDDICAGIRDLIPILNANELGPHLLEVKAEIDAHVEMTK